MQRKTAQSTQRSHVWPVLRRAIGVTVCLLIGASITVAIAWNQRYQRWYVLQEQMGLTSRQPGSSIPWPWPPPEGWPSHANFVSQDYSSGSVQFYRYLVRDPEASAQFRVPRFRELHRMRVAGDGWPFVAVRRISVVDHKQGYNIPVFGDGTILQTIRQGIDLDPNYDAPLPLLPAWPGFLANVAIFALPFCMLARGCQFCRRLRRRRRGVCTSCGYPATGLGVCPECGTPVVNHQAAPAD